MSWIHFGIWYEAWAACCREHNIDMSDKEEDRCTLASEKSYYNQKETPVWFQDSPFEAQMKDSLELDKQNDA